MGANAAGAAGIQPGPGLVVEGELDRADVDVAVEGAPPPVAEIFVPVPVPVRVHDVPKHSFTCTCTARRSRPSALQIMGCQL